MVLRKGIFNHNQNLSNTYFTFLDDQVQLVPWLLFGLCGVNGFSVVTLVLQEAATLGKKVMVLDYVVPTPKGNTWG